MTLNKDWCWYFGPFFSETSQVEQFFSVPKNHPAMSGLSSPKFTTKKPPGPRPVPDLGPRRGQLDGIQRTCRIAATWLLIVAIERVDFHIKNGGFP